MDQSIVDMNKIKVSVIIPVYNTEKYIADTLYSILGQTLREIEVIVINDGSKDNSLAILNEIASLDTRIHVFDQPNRGQAIARNVGMQKAKGEYIYLMDSDDLLDKDALATCYEKCTRDDLDFVFFDAECFSDEGDNLSLPLTYDRKGKIENRTYSGLNMISHLLDINGYRVPPWLYFIKTSYLRACQLSFVPGLLHEDQIFIAELFVLAQRVGYIPQKFFRRRLRPNSIMTNKYSMCNINTYYNMVLELQAFARNQNAEIKQTIHRVLKYTFDPAMYMANTFSFKERMSILITCQRKYSEYMTFNTKLVLLMPCLIKIKAIFK